MESHSDGEQIDHSGASITEVSDPIINAWELATPLPPPPKLPLRTGPVVSPLIEPAKPLMRWPTLTPNLRLLTYGSLVFGCGFGKPRVTFS